MSYLVDASVAFKWFSGKEDLRDDAIAFLRRSNGDLQAPELILAETANAAWKKQMRGEMSPIQASIIIPTLRIYIRVFHQTNDLIDRAFKISTSLRHPIYDCLYLACAEATGRTLITDDRRLHGVVAGSRHASSVRLLTELQ